MRYGRHLSNALSCAHETFKGLISFGPVSSQEDSFYFLEWWFSEQCRYRVDMKYNSCFVVFLSLLLILQLLLNSFFPLFPFSTSHRSSFFLSHLISFLLFSFFLYLKHLILHLISFCIPPSLHSHHPPILFILRFLLYPHRNCTSRALKVTWIWFVRIGWKDERDIANVAVLTAVNLGDYCLLSYNSV